MYLQEYLRELIYFRNLNSRKYLMNTNKDSPKSYAPKSQINQFTLYKYKIVDKEKQIF